MLYPLKFKPIYKSKLWGGHKIAKILNRNEVPEKCGESWELSAIDGDESEVINGDLAGNTLSELLEIYMDELVGKPTFEKYGNEFPLLIKFIDASDQLSIQVHPDDEIAKERHHAYGETEMWYVLQADKDASIITGFNQSVDQERFQKALNDNTLESLLNIETNISEGDVFYIPAGRIHSIGKGVLLAEIQQSSDVTYRIFDWNRLDLDGQPRELHTDLALGVIDYNHYSSYKTTYDKTVNKTNKIVNSPYFKTNFLPFSYPVEKSFFKDDCFVIYIALEGDFEILYQGGQTTVHQWEVVLIPADIPEFTLIPGARLVKVLEITV